MAGADGDFGLEVGQLWMMFVYSPNPTTIPTQHEPHRPDDVFRTINHHHQDISGHDGMDEHDLVGEMAGADGDFGLEVG